MSGGWNISNGGIPTGGGSGDVAGPASSTDGTFAVFDGTTGKTIKEAATAPLLTGAAAGGDLGGTYPNPSVIDDSHSHTEATLPATMPPSAHASSHLDGGADEITGGALVGLTQVGVDNLDLNGNTLQSTSGAMNVTGATSVSITATGTNFMEFNVAGLQTMYFKTNNTNRWTINQDGHLTGEAGIRLTMAGRFRGSQGANVASANDITLGAGGNYFLITGTTQVNTIAATDWTAGSIIVLQFDGSVTVAHNTAGTGASILLAGAGNLSATAGDTLTLIYDGATWREVARTVI